MIDRTAPRILLALCIVLLLGTAAAVGQDKPPLDHSAYDIWRGIGATELSRDGAWLAYQITYEHGDPELVVRATSGDAEYRVPRGGSAAFTASGAHLLTLIAPPMADSRQAQLDEIAEDQRPKAQLGVLSLSDGSLRTFDRVKSFRVPEEEGEWVAFLHEVDLTAEENDDGASADAGTEPAPGEAGAAGGATEVEQDPVAAALQERTPGTRLTLLDLATGTEYEFADVVDYAAAIDGGRLALATATADGAGDGVWLVDPVHGSAIPLLEGTGDYRDVTLDRPGRHVGFLTNRGDFGAEQASFELWVSTDGAAASRAAGADDLRDGWWVSEHRDPSFSEDGSRLFFGSAPRPAPEPEEEPMLDEERVRVDIWNWKDPLLQPQQLLEADEERNRSYLAYADLDDARVVQLADEALPEVRVLADGDADVALGETGLPYRMQQSWESPSSRSDVYRVDVRTGARELLLQGQRGDTRLSPDGRWLVWWNGQTLDWHARDLSDGDPMDLVLTDRVRQAFQDEDNDVPDEPGPYGVAGWTRAPSDSRPAGASEVEVVLYDRYDMWAFDPAGAAAPRQVTSGAGRDAHLQLRYIDLDPDDDWMEAGSLLLSGFDEENKDAGFWSVETFGTVPPVELVRAPKRFGRPTKAEEADLMVYTREDVGEFPDLWVAATDFSGARKLTAVNPQQADYNWATAELTEWRSLDGEVLQGLIHKPENFDPSRKYPMMVTFYERNSDNLHQYHPATPHRSVIRQTFYASRGYIVFTPDITYQVGYPGESALKDVVPGVLHMIDQGYVDADNIGVQGHSWGGYQIAYLVTKTDVFKAAAGGAPVSNMTSAYGGIRWGTGLSRMFQYEKTQSRIGATLWEAPLRYLENSPIFWADKVETPLLMLHNDHDGAVPWYQGIEMFVALRRLGKPAWLINYNDEPHWPTTHANKVDWNIRMQQFFDHYLKGAPAPVWLERGVPAVEKGETLGLELIER